MSHISDEKLLKHLFGAISDITPDLEDRLWDEPVTPADGSEWYLDTGGKYKKNQKKKNYFITAVAACCILCIISTCMFQFLPSASVYLDVNPSILLKVNNRDHVTKAEACNQDAKEILEDLDLRGTDLNVALYAILGSMVHHGYLTEYKDTVLVSVHSANTNRAAELEDSISVMITDDLKELINSGDVLTHSIDTDEISPSDNDTDATPGKDLFIQDLIKKFPELQSYPLNDMTMDEIIDLLDEKNLDYSGYKKSGITTDDADTITDYYNQDEEYRYEGDEEDDDYNDSEDDDDDDYDDDYEDDDDDD